MKFDSLLHAMLQTVRYTKKFVARNVAKVGRSSTAAIL